MKKKAGWVAIMMVIAGSVSADLIAGYDSWVNPTAGGTNGATIVAADVFSKLYFGSADWTRAATGEGCIDGTFGTVAGATTDTSSAFTGAIRVVGTGSYYVDVYVKNNGTDDMELSSFSFDAWRTFNKAPNVWSLVVLAGSDITTGTVGSGGSLFNQNIAVPGGTANYEDFDISLAGLADYTLAANESATFRLTLSGSTGSSYTYIDNVGIMGTVIPEPATIGMLGLGALVAICIRRVGTAK